MMNRVFKHAIITTVRSEYLLGIVSISLAFSSKKRIHVRNYKDPCESLEWRQGCGRNWEKVHEKNRRVLLLKSTRKILFGSWRELADCVTRRGIHRMRPVPVCDWHRRNRRCLGKRRYTYYVVVCKVCEVFLYTFTRDSLKNTDT